MRVFTMHVGSPGNIDIAYTVTQRRSRKEVLEGLPIEAPERDYFESDPLLSQSFPGGHFNCWGVPNRAEPAFRKTSPGDVVLIIPQISLNEETGLGGGVEYIAQVKATCPVRAWDASRVLWPNTPGDRRYPWLFFFDTESIYRPWFDFLKDLDYASNWDPRGWYRPVAEHRFAKYGGAEEYIDSLRLRQSSQLR